MINLLRKWLSRKSAKPSRVVRQARPRLECLEAREVPTVTPHGGAVLPNVQVQALYLGSDWVNSPTYYQQSRTLDNFLGQTVNSSYMDTLHNAGYGVGRGNAYTGAYWPANIDHTQYLTDSTIRSDLYAAINGHLLLPPGPGGLGGNNLYVVFVQDNVAVQAGFTDKTNSRYQNSVQDFLAYHGAFGATLPAYGGLFWYSADIHYAIVTYPGGSIPLSSGTAANLGRSWLNAQDTLTLSASHELAEAVTDPNIGYKTLGWNDDSYGEIGDIVNASTVYLNGYAVQREADQNDQAMTPAGARPVNPVNFLLDNSGHLYAGSGSNLTAVPTPHGRYNYPRVNYMSDQGIDNYGQAMIAVVLSDGSAWEYHAGSSTPWTYMDSGVKTARAGQGVSYLLYNYGTVGEYKDWGNGTLGTLTKIDTSGAAVSIDAGTDQYGVSMMTEVWSHNPSSYTYGYEISDSTGWHFLGTGVSTLSAGQQGNIGILYRSGNATLYNEASNSFTSKAWNIAQFTVGTDENGNVEFDMLDNNGTVSQYSTADGWSSVYGASSISKAHAGVMDAIFSGVYAEAYTPSGWQWLGSNAGAAA